MLWLCDTHDENVALKAAASAQTDTAKDWEQGVPEGTEAQNDADAVDAAVAAQPLLRRGARTCRGVRDRGASCCHS